MTIDAVKHSINRIDKLFAEKQGDAKIMNLFITAGYPDPAETAELILGYEKNGADLIELGMPFSDPLADGPTIQYSSEVALKKGVTMDTIFGIIRKVREKSDIPIVLMGYINPVIHYGVENFFRDAAAAGADGLIMPDVPVEESSYLLKPASEKHGLPLIYLVAPNSTDERMQLVDRNSGGFVYCVSVTGVTGARQGEDIRQSVGRFIQRVKKNVTENPVLIGFGISSHEDAVEISKEVDGFIVGSALINNIREHEGKENWKEKHFDFVRSLKYGG